MDDTEVGEKVRSEAVRRSGIEAVDRHAGMAGVKNPSRVYVLVWACPLM